MGEITLPCAICSAPKAPKSCDLCHAFICKNCHETLPAQAFIYMNHVPEKLGHSSYCIHCFDQHVAPGLQAYEAMAEKAREVYFITKNYPGYVHVLDRHEERVVIEDCDDRREAILRMAFSAAELGYNAIIQAHVQSFTPPHKGFKSARWKASALPAQIDGEQLERTSLKRI